MNKYTLYFILLILICILFLYNYFKKNENFTENELEQVFLDSNGKLPNGLYIIKFKNKNEYLSYEYNTQNYFSNLIIPLTKPPQKISSVFDVSGKLITSTSLDNPNIIFKINNNILYTSSSKSSFLVSTKYGIIPNNENCSMLTYPPYYTPPEDLFKKLQINNDYTLGFSYMKLNKFGKITTFQHRYANFNFYKPPPVEIIKPTNFSNYINIANITPGIYLIKFEKENAFLGYDELAESSVPNQKGIIIKTTDISLKNIFYIDSNRIIFSYDVYSEAKKYFTISARNATLQTLPMYDIQNYGLNPVFQPLYINFDKTIIIQPRDDQTENIKRYHYPLYPAGINNNALTQFGQITDIIFDEDGCFEFPNPLYATFNLYPVQFNRNINIIHSQIITDPIKIYNTSNTFLLPDHPPYISYSLNELNNINLVNPLSLNITSVNINTLQTGIYYINFAIANTNAFLGYELIPNSDNIKLVKNNNFTNSTNILFYIDASTNIIYTIDNLIPKYYIVYLNNFKKLEPSFKLYNNALKIILNPISPRLCQLTANDPQNIIHSFDINGEYTTSQQNFVNFKLYPYNSNNIIVNPANITPGLFYIKFASEQNTFLSYNPFGKAKFSCSYSPNGLGIITKTSSIYDTSYNFFYIQSDGSIYIPDNNGNPLYPIGGINTHIDNNILFLRPDNLIGQLKINFNGFIQSGNKIITNDVKLNFEDYNNPNNNTKFQILRGIPPPS